MNVVTPGGHGLGHIPDAPDARDFLLETPTIVQHQFVDLCRTGLLPPVWDQGQLGSCTAHGSVAAFLYAAAKAGTSLPMLSRLEVYFKARLAEGTADQDSGAMIRDAIKACAAGVAPETDWPYDPSTFTTMPSGVETDSIYHAVTYRGVDHTRAGMQLCLTAGFPVVIGVPLWASFESDAAMSSGVIPHPDPSEALLGGHCMLAVGIGYGSEWKRDDQFPAAVDKVLYCKIRNSWGTDIYAGGYLLMGMPYLRRHGGDFWMIEAAG